MYNIPTNYDDRSGHCIRRDCPRWVQAIGNFVGGAVAEATVAVNMGLNPVVNDKLDMKPGEPRARTAGRIIGGMAAATAGGYEATMGAGLVTTATPVCASGVGSVIGCPAMALGSAMVVHGSGMTLSGSWGTAEAAVALFSQANNSSSQSNHKFGKVSSQRYDGPKPSYTVNDAHVPGKRGFNPRKTPLPSDAEDVFQNAVPNDAQNPTA